MRRLFGTLRARLLLSHLAVVAIAVLILLLAGRQLGLVFLDDHLRSMADVIGGMGMVGQPARSGINSAFNRALLWLP